MEISYLSKKLSETYLYNKSNDYNTQLATAIVNAERYNVDESFDNIKYDIGRRRVNATVAKMINNPSIVLYKPVPSLPKSLKIVCAKDIKLNKDKLKIFIDISNLIYQTEGEDSKLEINNIDTLIAYMISAIFLRIYYEDPKRICKNSQMSLMLTEAFSCMTTYVIDFLYKISNVDVNRDMCKHLAAMYFMENVLRYSPETEKSTIDAICTKVSKLDTRTIGIVESYVRDDSFTNIKSFIETVSSLLKLDKFTLDAFVGKWLFLFGTGTQFGMEYLPAFSDMLTNAYTGAHINNQKTIEKIVGNNTVSQYSVSLINLGGTLL